MFISKQHISFEKIQRISVSPSLAAYGLIKSAPSKNEMVHSKQEAYLTLRMSLINFCFYLTLLSKQKDGYHIGWWLGMASLGFCVGKMRCTVYTMTPILLYLRLICVICESQSVYIIEHLWRCVCWLVPTAKVSCITVMKLYVFNYGNETVCILRSFMWTANLCVVCYFS